MQRKYNNEQEELGQVVLAAMGIMLMFGVVMYAWLVGII